MKRYAPATERNRAPIADVLELELPKTGTVLEIASGSGEHAVYFAGRFPALTWRPSDAYEEAIASIAEWRAEAGLANLAEPLQIDAAATRWPVETTNAIFCANMIHISPWTSTLGLFRNASKLLNSGAPLILYGPFIEADRDTAQSNLEFDESLRARSPDWGIRSLDEVDQIAEEAGLQRTARHEMPANNLTVVYRQH